MRNAIAKKMVAALPVSAAALVLFVLPASAADPSAPANTPVTTGCPAAAEVLSVEALTAAGYGVPAHIDDADNGGNANGIVCGIPLPIQLCEALVGGACPVPQLYRFSDDANPAKH